MEPDGSKNAESQTEDRVSPKIKANLEESIYVAVPLFTGDSKNEIDDDGSSICALQLSELITANIYTNTIEDRKPLNTADGVSYENVCSDSSPLNDESFLSSLYKYSLIFGLLVGCFIQSSSLGANYILMIVFGRDFSQMVKHHYCVVAFSLGWSCLTSLMGIVVLLILRSLVSLASNGLYKNIVSAGRPTFFINRQFSLVAFLEFPFAFGALAGVCGSWAATDLALGLNTHAYHSFLTLSLAYLGKIVFERCSDNASHTCEVDIEDADAKQCDEWSEKQKLLPSSAAQESETYVDKINMEFKVKGFATGWLVGFFIQLSSLGASFLIDVLVSVEGSSVAVSLSQESLLAFSLGWSFVFGTMGVTILLLLRYLIGIVCDYIISQSQGSDRETEEAEEMVDRWSISLEFFFAAGCLAGVNVAWLITDMGLGLNAHVWRSLVALCAAALWCLVLAHCFGFRKALYSAKTNQVTMVTKATQTTGSGMLIV